MNQVFWQFSLRGVQKDKYIFFLNIMDGGQPNLFFRTMQRLIGVKWKRVETPVQQPIPASQPQPEAPTAPPVTNPEPSNQSTGVTE